MFMVLQMDTRLRDFNTNCPFAGMGDLGLALRIKFLKTAQNTNIAKLYGHFRMISLNQVFMLCLNV